MSHLGNVRHAQVVRVLRANLSNNAMSLRIQSLRTRYIVKEVGLEMTADELDTLITDLKSLGK